MSKYGSYNLEKIAQDAPGDVPPPALDISCKPAPQRSSADLRRARAQERAKFQPKIKALKDKVVKAEARIAELEELSGILFNPKPDTDFASIHKRLKGGAGSAQRVLRRAGTRRHCP